MTWAAGGVSLSLMIDTSPVTYVVGLLLMALGGAMVVPLAVDYYLADGNAPVFVTAGLATAFLGLLLTIATRQDGLSGLICSRHSC